MEKTIFKSLVLLLSIPLINAVANALTFSSQLMYESIHTLEQFEAYQFSLIFMVIVLGIGVPLLEWLFDNGKISNLTSNILYTISFAVIALVTSDQFTFHTVEHSLIFLSIISIIFTRELMNRKVVVESHYA